MAGYLGAIPVPQATQHRESFTATSGQTTFNTAGYTVGFLDVYLNGSHLSPADFTATNGSDVVLASGASADDVCDIISYTAFEVNSQTFTGTTTLTGDLLLGDNDKAIFGAGSDLQIYHDGSNSFVIDQGTGGLVIRGSTYVALQGTNGENAVIASENGAVDLRYDNATKLATTNTGIDVTGAITADGLTVDGAVVFNEASADVDFRVESNGNANMLFVDGGNDAVGIGTSSPAFPLTVQANSNAEGLLILGRSADDISEIAFRESDNSTALGEIQYRQDHGILRHRVGYLSFATGGTTERMRIDSTGAVTMPTQPAFLAQVASAQTDLANYTNVLIFGTEIFDQNADFNPSNGIFTAPVTGKYMLSTFIGLDQIPATGTGVLQLQIVASNRTVYAAFDPIVFDATSTKYTFTQSLLLDMDASDTAKIQIYMPVSSSTVDINTQSFFSGYLVA